MQLSNLLSGEQSPGQGNSGLRDSSGIVALSPGIKTGHEGQQVTNRDENLPERFPSLLQED